MANSNSDLAAKNVMLSNWKWCSKEVQMKEKKQRNKRNEWMSDRRATDIEKAARWLRRCSGTNKRQTKSRRPIDVLTTSFYTWFTLFSCMTDNYTEVCFGKEAQINRRHLENKSAPEHRLINNLKSFSFKQLRLEMRPSVQWRSGQRLVISYLVANGKHVIRALQLIGHIITKCLKNQIKN